MKTLVRTLLVWFVLLAVPFQGFAAAAMTCAHGVASAPAQHELKRPCHGDSLQAAQPAGSDAVQDEHGEQGDQSHQKKCGNCAACSVGTAMAPASHAGAPDCCPGNCCPSAAPARLAAAEPDLPERPPRTILA